MRQFFLHTLTLLISIVFSLFILETLLHFTKYKAVYLPPMEPRGYSSPDTSIGYDITPNFSSTTLSFSDGSFDVWSNSLGCFDAEYNQEKPYIYFTGDSFTWGWVPHEKNWTQGVENILGIRTLTCGVNGYGTRQELVKTARHLAILPTPALVVVGYLGANDVDDDNLFPHYAVADGYRVSTSQKCDTAAVAPFESTATSSCIVTDPPVTLFSRIKVFLSLHSVLYNFAKRDLNIESRGRQALIAIFPDAWLEKSGIVHFPKQDTATTTEAVAQASLPARHIENMLDFKTLASYRHTRALIVLIPSKAETRAEKIDPDSPNQKMKAVLEKERISYIDLLPDFRKYEKLPEKPLYWSIDGHWNPGGNRLAGLLVSKYILEHNLVITSPWNKEAELGKIREALKTEFDSK